MVLTHAVEFDVGVSADRRVDEIVDLARRARRQLGKLVDAAPVHGDLRDLLVSDEIADLSRISLNVHGISFYRNCFLCGAHLHLEIDADTVANGQHNAFLLRSLKSSSRGLDLVVADLEIGGNVLASIVRWIRAALARIGIGDDYSNVRNNGTRRIGNCPNDRGLLRERGSRKTNQGNQKNK